MKNLIVALLIVGLVGMYLWHFDPSAIKKNLEKKTGRTTPGKTPVVCWCYLDRGEILTGEGRRAHGLLNPAQVTLKYAMSRDLSNQEAFSETIPKEQAVFTPKNKLTRYQRKQRKKLLSENPRYAATVENFAGNTATVHLVIQSKKRQFEQWAMLEKHSQGWVIREMSNDDL